jgi:hypothetical protein
MRTTRVGERAPTPSGVRCAYAARPSSAHATSVVFTHFEGHDASASQRYEPSLVGTRAAGVGRRDSHAVETWKNLPRLALGSARQGCEVDVRLSGARIDAGCPIGGYVARRGRFCHVSKTSAPAFAAKGQGKEVGHPRRLARSAGVGVSYGLAMSRAGGRGVRWCFVGLRPWTKSYIESFAASR